MGSLQDALLKTGLAKEQANRDPRRGSKRKRNAKPGGHEASGNDASSGRSGPSPDRSQASKNAKRKRQPTDLEQAWAARRRAEEAEKTRAKARRLADQETRRQRNLKLDALLAGGGLNRDDADVPRYFEHLGRIRRVMCSPEQRDEINSGSLGIVNLRGRYWIVGPAIVAEWRALAPDLVPDLSGAEPDEPDGYPPVPDDLTW